MFNRMGTANTKSRTSSMAAVQPVPAKGTAKRAPHMHGWVVHIACARCVVGRRSPKCGRLCQTLQ